MIEVGWLFVYTPLPWLALFYFTAYRHNLSRIVKPFRDNYDSTAWRSVCKHLDLVRSDAPKPSRRLWKSKDLILLLVAMMISLLGLTIVVSRDWYSPALLQVASAFVLFLVLINRIGRLPSKPYSDTLRYPRLGTRIRHLSKARGERMHADSQDNYDLAVQTRDR